MPENEPRPAPQEKVDIYRRYREKIYPNLRARQNLHEHLYWCTYETGLDKRHFRTPTKPPRARLMVEAPVNHIAMDKLTVSQEPQLKGPTGMETKKASETADKVERWAQALLDEWSQVQPYFLRELTKSLSWRGEGYLKLEVDPQMVASPDVFKGNPFRLAGPDAVNIYASIDTDDKGRPMEIFEQKVVSARFVRKLLREWNQDDDSLKFLPDIKDDELVLLVEWWTPDWRGFFSGQHDMGDGTWQALPIQVATLEEPGELVVENPLGFVPYKRGYSGHGKMPYDGDPAAIAVGILTGWESYIVAEARNVTMIDTATAKIAATPVIIDVPDDVELDTEDLDLGPGTAWVQKHGIKYTVVDIPPVPPAIVQELDETRKMFEAFMPGIISGAFERGGEAAISRATRLSQAGLLWASQFIAARRMIGGMLGMALEVLEKVIESSVELRGLALKPSDINGVYDLDVDIMPGNPDERRWDILLGKSLEGIWPEDDIATEFYHQPDAATFIAKRDAQRFKNSDPRIQAFVVGTALKRLGMDEELAILEAEVGPIEQLAQGLPPPGGNGSQDFTVGEQVPGVGGSPTRGVAGIAQGQMTEPAGLANQRRVERVLSRIPGGR